MSAEPARLSAAQRAMLERIAKHGEPLRGLRGRSQHGGAAGTLASLYRRGLVVGRRPSPTADGRAALVEKGTSYVNGHNLGPAERDPTTGNIEQGPHVTRRAAIAGDIAVDRVDRSPMNAKRWTLSLACGHVIWVTSARKPARKTAKCTTCARG